MSPGDYYVIRPGVQKEPVTFEGPAGPVTMDKITLTNDPVLLEFARSKGYNTRHFGSLNKATEQKINSRDESQVYSTIEKE